MVESIPPIEDASGKTTTLALRLQFCYCTGVPYQGLSKREMEIRRAVGDRVRQLRAKQPDGKHTQTWLARQIGEDKSGVIRLEKGERPVTVELVELLAKAFGMPPLEFLAGGAAPVWRLGNEEDRIAAIRSRYLDQAEEQADRIASQFAANYLTELQTETSQLAVRLEDLLARLSPIASDERRRAAALEYEINRQQSQVEAVERNRRRSQT